MQILQYMPNNLYKGVFKKRGKIREKRAGFHGWGVLDVWQKDIMEKEP